MEHLYLPIDLDLINELDITNIPIDMSDLRFPCSSELKIRSAFIFIRNINLNLNLDFSNCLYNTKEEFILTYMKGNIKVDIPIIRNTWIDILLSKYTSDFDISGMLSKEEIDKFVERNGDIIKNIYELIASLSVLGVYKYTKSNASGAQLIEFDNQFIETDYDEINFYNFSLLTDSEYFGFLFQNSTNLNPKFYKNYFDGEDQLAIARINTNLPIINLLNILFAPSEVQDNFIEGLNGMFTSVSEESKDE